MRGRVYLCQGREHVYASMERFRALPDDERRGDVLVGNYRAMNTNGLVALGANAYSDFYIVNAVSFSCTRQLSA